MSRVGTIIASLSLALAFSQATVDARTAQETTEPDSASANVDTKGDDRRLGELRKGDRQWGLVAGVGIAHEVFGGVADRQFLVLGGQHGRIFTNAIGPRFMKAHMEVGGEIYPVFLMFQDPTTYGFTFTLLFRHYMAPASKVKPFLSFALGTLVSVESNSSRVEPSQLHDSARARRHVVPQTPSCLFTRVSSPAPLQQLVVDGQSWH